MLRINPAISKIQQKTLIAAISLNSILIGEFLSLPQSSSALQVIYTYTSKYTSLEVYINILLNILVTQRFK